PLVPCECALSDGAGVGSLRPSHRHWSETNDCPDHGLDPGPSGGRRSVLWPFSAPRAVGSEFALFPVCGGGALAGGAAPSSGVTRSRSRGRGQPASGALVSGFAAYRFGLCASELSRGHTF